MVNCNAVNCPSTSSGKKSVSGKGISFHCLPRDKETRERWKANLKRGNPPPDANIRICSLPVPPPLVIYVTPCDGGAEQVEEISGQDPVDPVDPTISSQHTLSKKMRVGLENWVSAAREWIVKRKPATGSSGSDQGEKVDDKRRRGGEESKRRRRSTLIVDLGLQLVSTRPQPLAKIDS